MKAEQGNFKFHEQLCFTILLPCCNMCERVLKIGSMSKTISKDIAIIGAGPVGIFAIFEAGMLGLSSVVIDTLDFPGGQCAALYPEKPIYDIPGFQSITGQKLVENLLEQAKPFGAQFLLSNQIVEFEKHQDFIRLTTSKGIKIECKCAIIAAGCGAFGPNKPPLENINEFEDKSVHYYVRNKEQFRGKEVTIAGGGDSAIDWVIELASIASKVYLVHRRDRFRAAPGSMEKVHELCDKGKVEILTPFQLKQLHGSGGVLESIDVYSFEGEVKNIKCQYLLPFYGLSMKLGPIANWGLNLEQNHIHVFEENNETNISRVFAVGDICTYPGKLKLILTGFAEVAKACYKAYEYVNPEKPLHFEYSTTKGVPK